MMVYSANNLPYSALSGVMTGDLGERTSLSSYRFVCAMIAQLVIQGLALPMVHHFGQGDNAKGYQVTIGIFSALAVVLFLITFATTKERIQPPPDQKAPIRQHFADLLQNGPWLAMFVLTLVLFITLSMRGSVVPYYFNYFVDKASLARLLGSFGASAVRGGGGRQPRVQRLQRAGHRGDDHRHLLLEEPRHPVRQAQRLHRGPRRDDLLHRDLRACCRPRRSRRCSCREILRQFAYGFTIPLLWAMMADVADYSEWKTGRRATAIVFSAIVFALKAGLGFGGAITGFVLSLYGYVPNVGAGRPRRSTASA